MPSAKRFEKGLSYKEFLYRMNGRDSLYTHHYKRAAITKTDKAFWDHFDCINILVLTESWCGDSIAVLPVVQKWSENRSTVDLRILRRDENLDIMDQYLTRGGRAIPKFIFMDKAFREIANWGPRPQPAQNIFELHRPKLLTGEIDKATVHQKIRRFYAKDRGCTIIAELKELLEKKRTAQ